MIKLSREKSTPNCQSSSDPLFPQWIIDSCSQRSAQGWHSIWGTTSFPVSSSSEFTRGFPNVLSGTCREEPYSNAPRQHRTILVLTTWAEQQPEQAVGGEVAGMVDANLLESCLVSHPDCTFALANQEAIELSNSCWDAGQMPKGKKKSEGKHAGQKGFLWFWTTSSWSSQQVSRGGLKGDRILWRPIKCHVTWRALSRHKCPRRGGLALPCTH